jgi:protein gp37
MGDGTSIEWCDCTWNVTRGCRKKSPGCKNCYAARVAARFSKPGQPYEGLAEFGPSGPNWTGNVLLVRDALAKPLHWKKPRRIFVNSMSDIFDKGFTNKTIAAVFGVMVACPQHTFQILTKDAERMHDWFKWVESHSVAPKLLSPYAVYSQHANAIIPDDERKLLSQRWWLVEKQWPLPNVWLGVSAESQQYADERIPWLLETPAAKRFVSYEPALGPIDIEEYMDPAGAPCGASNEALDWVIAGAESGPDARPMDENWVRSVRDQCARHGVAFFYKQNVTDEFGTGSKKVSLPMLDGEQHKEFPR